MCFWKKKSKKEDNTNRFYLKMVSNGLYILIHGINDPHNDIALGENHHTLTEEQYNKIKNLFQQNLDNLTTIYKKQTQQYLADNVIEGQNKYITLKLGDTSIQVNAAINDPEDKLFLSNMFEHARHIIE